MSLTDELLARFKGGQIKLDNKIEHYTYCGEIAEIWLAERAGSPVLSVRLAWMARLEGGRWVHDDELTYSVNLMDEMTTIDESIPDEITIDSWISNETITIVLAANPVLDPEKIEQVTV